MKKGLVVLALIVLTVPVAYAASPGKNTSAKTTPSAKSSEENPAKACKAERTAMGIDEFAKKYGTNRNLRNAFGKCVSGKSKGQDEKAKDEKDEDEKSAKADKDENGSSKAVEQCKKQRTDMGAEAFAKKYGTSHNKADAFGKCVSSSSKNEKDEKDEKDETD